MTLEAVWKDLWERNEYVRYFHDLRKGKLEKVRDLKRALKHLGVQVSGTGILVRRRQRPARHVRKMPSGKRVIVNKAITKKRVKRKNFPSIPPRPMLAKPGPDFLEKPDWWSERKYDGFRAVAIKRGNKVKLFSRSGIEYTQNFPDIVEDLKEINENFIIDGEIAYIDKKGNDQFDIIAKRIQIKDPIISKQYAKQYPAVYYVFDILERGNKSKEYMKNLSLTLRRVELGMLLQKQRKHVREVGFRKGLGERRALLQDQKRLKREGVIHKNPKSIYKEDYRTGDWRKHKFEKEMDVLAVGYQKGQGRLKGTLGALYLFTYDNDNPKNLIYIGRAGTGLSDKQRASLKELMDSKQSSAPDIPSLHKRFTKQKIADSVWVNPFSVVQVKFMEVSKDKRLRHPVFVRLRPGKTPNEVDKI